MRRALNSRSTGSAFGGKASFADLWTGNVPALAVSYPDAARAYDSSSADAALAQHLAFWTGNDYTRIERLMRLSQRRCVLIAPALGVDSAWLYQFVERVARHALHINRVHFDSLRWWLERERKITGDQIALITAGIQRVNLPRAFKLYAKPMKGL